MLWLVVGVLWGINPIYVEGWDYTHGSAAEACRVERGEARAIIACANRETRTVTIDLEAVQVVAQIWAVTDAGHPCADWWYVYLDALRHENLHVLGYDHGPGGGFQNAQCRRVGVTIL